MGLPKNFDARHADTREGKYVCMHISFRQVNDCEKYTFLYKATGLRKAYFSASSGKGTAIQF